MDSAVRLAVVNHARLGAVGHNARALVASLAAVLCLVANPLHAAIAADFNGDGVPDAVVLPHPPETNIIIQVSGFAPQILKISSPIISVVATDVDHDGALDLSVLSVRRGLHVWLNKLNKAGRGRFAALKKHRTLQPVGYPHASLRTARQHRYDAPVASGDQGSSPDADAPRAGPVFEVPPGDLTVPALVFTSSANLPKSTAPRGPPSPAAD